MTKKANILSLFLLLILLVDYSFAGFYEKGGFEQVEKEYVKLYKIEKIQNALKPYEFTQYENIGCEKYVTPYNDLTDFGKEVYNNEKESIPESDQNILLQIAETAQNLNREIFNDFVEKIKWDGSKYLRAANNYGEYTREKLANTLNAINAYFDAIDQLNTGSLKSCNDIVSLCQNNFQITQGDHTNPLTDTKSVRFITSPFKYLSLARKKQLIDLLHKCSYAELQNKGDDVDAGTILATIFNTSNEKSNAQYADNKALIDYIAEKKYLKHFVEDLHGVQYEGFMNALLNMILKNYDYSDFKIGNPETSPNYIKFSKAYLQPNSEKILDNGDVSLQVKHWFSSNEYPVVAAPYTPVAVEFVNDVNFGTNLTFNKGQTVVLPMIWAYQLFWNDTKAARWKTAQITAEVGLTFLGVGEITAAVRLYRAGQTARATYLTIKALGDIGVGFTDIYLQNNDVLTDEQLAKWNKFVLVYSVGSLGTSAADGLIQKLGKKAINSSDDFAKIEQEVDNLTEEGYNKLAKAEKDQIDEVVDWEHLSDYAGADDLLEVAENIRYINGWTKESILTEVVRRKTAGLAPLNPTEYLSADYIKNHLSKFNKKASYFMTGEQYDRFLKNASYAGRSDGLYVTTSSKADEVLMNAKGDIIVVEKEMSILSGEWQGKGGLYRIDIENPELYNLRMPSGAETAANLYYTPGGYTANGIIEAVTDPIPISNVKVTLVIK
ncbi:hypothetical protein FACS189429_6480 [Bacteroidia bacterium]|nr:hypothetical protein FACS189429_6480 [Bacteroidia bacterium]GHV45027.1 hypothetical protein FACS1894180_7100 [Bacteroidia bacterium]